MHPRLGRAVGMRLLDDCLIAYVLQQVEADSSRTEWSEDHDFFARFYGAYSGLILSWTPLLIHRIPKVLTQASFC